MSPAQIIAKAEQYFDGRFGLKKTNSDTSCCVDFVGNLGFVTVRVTASGNQNDVVLTTRELEYQALEFLKRV